jgi:hypothetical protein
MTRAALRHDDQRPVGARRPAVATGRPHDTLDKIARAMSHPGPATNSHHLRHQAGMLDNTPKSLENDRCPRLHGMGGR